MIDLTTEDNPQFLFEKAKAYLQKTDENGTSVYDLLTHAILYIQNEQGLDLKNLDFEKLIHNLNQDLFKNDNFVKPRTYETLWERNEPPEQDTRRASTTRTLLKKQMTNARGIRNRYEDEQEKKRIEAELRAKELAESGEQEEEEEEEEENIIAARSYIHSNVQGITNVMEDSFWFNVMGVGLTSEETYKLALAMNILKKEQNLDRLRFFGKITGSNMNYIIVESEHKPLPESVSKHLKQGLFITPKVKYDEKNMNSIPAEDGGEGTNRFTYWVCNNIGDSWTQLPDVTPQQIVGARSIRKKFTGDLIQRINSYPPFPGNEANYLRAQISRIVSSTLVSPSIFAEFEIPEPEEEDEDEKNKKPIPKYPQFQLKALEERELPMKEFLNLENWQHLGQHIRSIGRCTKYKPPKENEEDEEDEEEEESPDNVEKLKTLKEDTAMILPGMKRVKKKKAKTSEEDEEEEGEEESEEEEENDEENPDAKNWKQTTKIAPWVIRQYNTLFSKQYSVIGLRSVRWPGAYAFCVKNGAKFSNIYIGNGLKETFGSFTPVMPPSVLSEANDPEEKKDPSARNEKRVLAGDEPLDEDAQDDDAKTNTEDDVSDEEDEDD